MNFNWEIYKELNPDLKVAGLKSKKDYTNHFIINGKKEGRPWNIYSKYTDFSWILYRSIYDDLSRLNKTQLENHWIFHGRHEGRKYRDEINKSLEDTITFIIPSINRDTLDRTVRSLQDQSNPNWKAIIIYDGVEGNTFDDDRIQTEKTNKCGSKSTVHGQAGLVRNVGLLRCKTKWIGFLDDDDTLHIDYVKTLYEKYSNYDLVIWRMINKQDGSILPEHDRRDLVYGHVGISFCFKNIFGLVFPGNSNREDYDFLTRLVYFTNNYIITPEVYYNVGH
jgi:hypothetical protein